MAFAPETGIFRAPPPAARASAFMQNIRNIDIIAGIDHS
jgi:hypothetical protein